MGTRILVYALVAGIVATLAPEAAASAASSRRASLGAAPDAGRPAGTASATTLPPHLRQFIDSTDGIPEATLEALDNTYVFVDGKRLRCSDAETYRQTKSTFEAVKARCFHARPPVDNRDEIFFPRCFFDKSAATGISFHGRYCAKGQNNILRLNMECNEPGALYEHPGCTPETPADAVCRWHQFCYLNQDAGPQRALLNAVLTSSPVTKQLREQLSAAASVVRSVAALLRERRAEAGDDAGARIYRLLARALADPALPTEAIQVAATRPAGSCGGILRAGEMQPLAAALPQGEHAHLCDHTARLLVGAARPEVAAVRSALLCASPRGLDDSLLVLSAGERARAGEDASFARCVLTRAEACGADSAARGCQPAEVAGSCLGSLAGGARRREDDAAAAVAAGMSTFVAAAERRGVLSELAALLASDAEEEDASLDIVLSFREALALSPTLAGAAEAWGSTRRPLVEFVEAAVAAAEALVADLAGEPGLLSLWGAADSVSDSPAASLEISHWVAALAITSAGAPAVDPPAVFRAMYCSDEPTRTSPGHGTADSVYTALPPDVCMVAAALIDMDHRSHAFAETLESLRLNAAARAFRLDRLVQRINILRRLPGAASVAADAIARELLGAGPAAFSPGSSAAVPSWAAAAAAAAARAPHAAGRSRSATAHAVGEDASVANPLFSPDAASFVGAMREEYAHKGGARRLLARTGRGARGAGALAPVDEEPGAWPLAREEQARSGMVASSAAAAQALGDSGGDDDEAPATLPGTGSLPDAPEPGSEGGAVDENAAAAATEPLASSVWVAEARRAMAEVEHTVDSDSLPQDARGANRARGRAVSLATALAATLQGTVDRLTDVKQAGLCACDKALDTPWSNAMVLGRVERIVPCYAEPEARECLAVFGAFSLRAVAVVLNTAACSSGRAGSASGCAAALRRGYHDHLVAIYTKTKLPVWSMSEPWPVPFHWSSDTSPLEMARETCPDSTCAAGAEAMRYNLNSHGCCSNPGVIKVIGSVLDLAVQAMRLDRKATDRNKETVADKEMCTGCKYVWSRMDQMFPTEQRGGASVEKLYSAWTGLCGSMTSVFLPACREMEADAMDLVRDFAYNVDADSLCSMYCASAKHAEQ